MRTHQSALHDSASPPAQHHPTAVPRGFVSAAASCLPPEHPPTRGSASVSAASNLPPEHPPASSSPFASFSSAPPPPPPPGSPSRPQQPATTRSPPSQLTAAHQVSPAPPPAGSLGKSHDWSGSDDEYETIGGSDDDTTHHPRRRRPPAAAEPAPPVLLPAAPDDTSRPLDAEAESAAVRGMYAAASRDGLYGRAAGVQRCKKLRIVILGFGYTARQKMVLE
jgi:hypothetical protein